jgi:hypothetical protein
MVAFGPLAPSLAALALTLPAGRVAALVLAAPVDAIVAAGQGVAALRAGEVIIVDGAGRMVAGCRGMTTVAHERNAPDGTASTREEVLHEAGMSSDDVSPEAEELLDDEGVELRAPAAPVIATSGITRALALASASKELWIGTNDGLWRRGLVDDACVRVGLGGRAIGVVAARGPSVVAISGFTVWRSRDGGTSFDVAAVLTSAAHSVAIGADGVTVMVADADGLVEIDAARAVKRRLEHRIDALASCGDAVVALADDGIHRFDADGMEGFAPARPPVRALACHAEGLVAAGVGAWVSADGARWREDEGTTGRSFSAIAVAGGRRWLVTEAGELVLADPPRGGDLLAPAAEDLAIEPLPPVTRRTAPPIWAVLLPRISIVFDGRAASTGVAGWRLRFLITLYFDRRHPGAATLQGEDLP